MSNSILSIGVQGVQAGLARANLAASDIVKAGLDDTGSGPGLTSSLVELKAGEIAVKASAAVIKSADETMGTLIDIKA